MLKELKNKEMNMKNLLKFSVNKTISRKRQSDKLLKNKRKNMKRENKEIL